MTCARLSHLPLVPAPAGTQRKTPGRRPAPFSLRPAAVFACRIPGYAVTSGERANQPEVV